MNFSRMVGALARAALVALVIATPSLLLPQVSADTAQVVLLMALAAAAFTFVEYNSAYPSLVEFRDAPPLNRIRLVAFTVIVFSLALIARGEVQPTTLTALVSAIGTNLGDWIDFPYSPVRLVVLMLPEGVDATLVDKVRTAAGMSYLASIVALGTFVVILRLGAWPARQGSFNVWVNLPTFDPTAGGDVVERLRRDAGVNLILGFLLPFIIPAVVKLASDVFDPVSLADPQTLIWTMTAWAFLPASLLMRGIALNRIAEMICEQRRRAYRADAGLATA